MKDSRIKGLILIFAMLVILPACVAQSSSKLSATAAPTSPYVALLNSPVRGLSAEEIAELKNGAGAGFARAAELNGYPGPRHIIDLKDQLGLSEDQLGQVQELYDAMNAEARQIGTDILQLEADLEQAFRDRAIDAASLEAKVNVLANKYSELRLIHLHTHLVAIELLTPDQLDRYNELRGYSPQNSSDHSGGHHP